MCRIEERKNNDGLVYAVVEEGNPKSRVRDLHENHILSREEFQHLLQEKATENNSSSNGSNNSNIAVRKEWTLGTAAMAVIQIFHNSFQLFTPTIRK